MPKKYQCEVRLSVWKAREPQSSSLTHSLDVVKEVGDFRFMAQEGFMVWTLNTKNQIIDKHIVSIGSINQCLVHPREVFRPAIMDGANCIILIHNHPSGSIKPGIDDIKLTERLVSAGELLDIKVLDHVIVTSEEGLDFYSFETEGMLGKGD